MNFAHPSWLLAGLAALAAMAWLWRAADTRQSQALEQFISPQLRAQLTQSISNARRRIKRALFGAAVGLLFVALAEPRLGYRWEQVTRRGNDIVFAVDTSRSMSTPDVKPNRLARAKLAIDDFVSRLNGDAVGLVAFAGTAFLQCPVTLDYGAFHESLAALDTHIIPRGGTNISSAIHEAQAALQHRPGSDKILVLVTDGEDLEGDSLAAAKQAEQQGLKIFTVGVGTPNGELIPLPPDRGGGFLKDRDGHLVKSRLDESALRALAAATGGIYAPLGANNEGLDTIYQAALAPLAKHELEARSEKVFTERYQWPLGLALLLLMASLGVGTRRRRAASRAIAATPSTGHGRRPAARFAVPTMALAVSLYGLLTMQTAHASPASAASAYAHGDFAKAQQEYSAALTRDPKQPVLQFDAGAAAYRAGAYDRAVEAFQASVDTSQSGSAKRLAEQEDAYYNLGNTLYREGQRTRQSNAQKTIEDWTHAVKSYDAALQLQAGDSDSKFNRDLVNRQLEALKKAQSQQSQSQSQQSQAKQSQQSKSQSKPQQGQGQSAKTNGGQANPQQQAGQPKPQSGGQQQSSGQPGQQQQPQQARQGQQPGQTQAGQQQGQQARQGQPDQAQPGQRGQQPQPEQQASAVSAGSNPRPDRQQRAGGLGGEQIAQAGDEQRQPGGMSRQEARELLDSVKDEERRPPAAPVARNSANDSVSDEPLKDW